MLLQNMNCGQECRGKSWQGSKTVYCANSQLGGLNTDRGGMERDVIFLCERSLQCLCCSKI